MKINNLLTCNTILINLMESKKCFYISLKENQSYLSVYSSILWLFYVNILQIWGFLHFHESGHEMPVSSELHDCFL